MTLHISISKELEDKLRAPAAATGQPVEQVVVRLVEECVDRPSLEEMLAPVRDEFEASGMSEDELTDLLERAKHEMRAARRARRAS
jgi:hypothetical protein